MAWRCVRKGHRGQRIPGSIPRPFPARLSRARAWTSPWLRTASAAWSRVRLRSKQVDVGHHDLQDALGDREQREPCHLLLVRNGSPIVPLLKCGSVTPDHAHFLLEFVDALDEAVVLLDAPGELIDLKLHHRAAARVRNDRPDQRYDAAGECHHSRLHKDLSVGHGSIASAPSSVAI